MTSSSDESKYLLSCNTPHLPLELEDYSPESLGDSPKIRTYIYTRDDIAVSNRRNQNINLKGIKKDLLIQS